MKQEGSLLRNCPCHVELILSEKGETVEKAEEEARCFGVASDLLLQFLSAKVIMFKLDRISWEHLTASGKEA